METENGVMVILYYGRMVVCFLSWILIFRLELPISVQFCSITQHFRNIEIVFLTGNE
jgi:hypothetical protein